MLVKTAAEQRECGLTSCWAAFLMLSFAFKLALLRLTLKLTTKKNNPDSIWSTKPYIGKSQAQGNAFKQSRNIERERYHRNVPKSRSIANYHINLHYPQLPNRLLYKKKSTYTPLILILPGFEQGLSGLDLVIRRELRGEKIEIELQRVEKRKTILSQPVEPLQRNLLLASSPWFTVLLNRKDMFDGLLVGVVPFSLRLLHLYYYLVHVPLAHHTNNNLSTKN